MDATQVKRTANLGITILAGGAYFFAFFLLSSLLTVRARVRATRVKGMRREAPRHGTNTPRRGMMMMKSEDMSANESIL